MITREELKTLLHYNPATGVFTWKFREGDSKGVKIFNGRNANKQAGHLDTPTGYILIGLPGCKVRAHRLAFLYMGEPIPDVTDHDNRNRADNAWINLRACSQEDNAKNQKLRSNNKSGVMGVTWIKRTQRWNAYIQINKRRKFLGSFINKADAVQIRRQAEVTQNYHPNHGK